MSRQPCVRQLQVWNAGRCFPEAEKCGKKALNNSVLRIRDCNPQCGSQIPLTQQPYRGKKKKKKVLFPSLPTKPENKNILAKTSSPSTFAADLCASGAASDAEPVFWLCCVLVSPKWWHSNHSGMHLIELLSEISPAGQGAVGLSDRQDFYFSHYSLCCCARQWGSKSRVTQGRYFVPSSTLC